ncbi:HNH endonuclease [Chloroflexota bacterium]
MIQPQIKILLGFDKKTSNTIVRKEWNKRIKNVCKPCWELKYCPYGPLVEDFPLLGPTRNEAIDHNNFLIKQLELGVYNGKRKLIIEEMVQEFNPNNYPKKHPKCDLEKACSVFGHLCPVFFVNEPFTETQELRRIGRYIPRHIMLKVVRRDSNQCQICGKTLKDKEIEFDHTIPLSKGGSSEENNIRVICSDCNRSKSNKYNP